eukprot:TRINITY_DN608451_c0_g1_i1.p1 TRINITY_DN608451_c0_g1~~TRINITY_DN608451_c0_g1_i1.p1  ORF type:complete len:160 (-),score=32.22 TRINITY_DN608451_c0_g1_i1:64-543(-)
MPHSFGIRARTRQMFKRGFREHGTIALGTFLKNYHIGDVVDIVVNSAQQKGMPSKIFHGKTGVVFDVTPHAIGVVVRKPVRGRVVEKHLHVRVEHIRHSKCRQDFLDRVKSNDLAKKEAKKTGVTKVLKRMPAQPKEGFTLRVTEEIEEIFQQPYEFMV